MNEVKIEINGVELSAPADLTILQAARLVDVDIPTLCHLDLHNPQVAFKEASCRVCMVEIEGRKNLAPACITTITEGMRVKTSTPRAIRARRTSVELLLSDHPQDCLVCEKNQNCDLQQLAAKLGLRNELKYQGAMSCYEKDCSSNSIQRNPDKCVLCRRCEIMCNDFQTCGVLSAVGRGFEAIIKPTFGLPMMETACTFCGQCVAVCPTAALSEMSVVSEVWDAINNPDKFVVVQTAPAVRVALGEEFGMEPGQAVTGKMVALLRKLGFDRVFDTDFAADLTIIEEASEFVHRLQHNGTLPILTSCCPAWVKFFEHQFPDLMAIPSSCKSPHEMFGAIAKSYYCEKFGIDPQRLIVVSVMPCLAKKYEAARPELSNKGSRNVDYVITTRELAKMAKEAAIDFKVLEDEVFDNPLGESTGASVIFGATGGGIEATLRTAYEWLTETTLEKVDFEELRGMKGIKSATVKINGMDVRIAVAHGLGNARTLLESIRDGSCRYHAIEIMACPGGCVGGGGQPYHHGDIEVLKARTRAIYNEDRNKTLRKSHENPYVQELYKEFLGKPYQDKAIKFLHTHYTERENI